MPTFQRIPINLEAHQWFKNGDHPNDDCALIEPPDGGTQFEPFLSEGQVVRYFRHPDVSGETICQKCGIRMHEHGWIDTLEDGHNVCPGDWIVQGIQGEYWPVKPDVFAQTYVQVDKPRAFA